MFQLEKINQNLRLHGNITEHYEQNITTVSKSPAGVLGHSACQIQQCQNLDERNTTLSKNDGIGVDDPFGLLGERNHYAPGLQFGW